MMCQGTNRIEGIWIQNYRALKDVRLGVCAEKGAPLTPLTVLIGENGAGKSSFIDALGFVADCLRVGVEEACDLKERGGYDKIRSQGSEGTMSFQFHFREFEESEGSLLVVYGLVLDTDKEGRPFVCGEVLLADSDGGTRPIMYLQNGAGVVWKGALRSESLSWKSLSGDERCDWKGAFAKFAAGDLPEGAERFALADTRHLGIATLGLLTDHPRIAAFRAFVEGWYLSYFSPDAARGLPVTGAQQMLNVRGDNLGNVVQFLKRDRPADFNRVLAGIAAKIPGIKTIDTQATPDGRLLLRFFCEGFEKPFYAQQMSDGTLKVLAYLLLLSFPNAVPLICIEEPENGLYPHLLETLASEFRACANGRDDAPQVFVTTHQPCFVNGLSPEEVWILEKGKDGFTTARRASEDKLVRELVEQGLPLGNLWTSNYLDGK